MDTPTQGKASQPQQPDANKTPHTAFQRVKESLEVYYFITFPNKTMKSLEAGTESSTTDTFTVDQSRGTTVAQCMGG